MAAEALEAAAARAGVAIQVETQGSAGSTPLPRETIAGSRRRDLRRRRRASATAAGSPASRSCRSGVKRPIDDADAMIAEALRYADDPNAPRVEGAAGDAGGGWPPAVSETLGRPHPPGADDRCLLHDPVRRRGRSADRSAASCSAATRSSAPTARSRSTTRSSTCPTPRRWGCDHALFDSGFFAYIGALFFIIGKTAFMLFIPALAGYIAYAIADRPGIAPGLRHGWPGRQPVQRDRRGRQRVASRPPASSAPSSAACSPASSAHWIAALEGAGLGPRPDAGAGDPAARLASSAGLTMIIVLGKPIGWLMEQLNEGLNIMSGQQRHPARRRPRPDDGLRHGRPAQQGRLQLRRRRCRGRGLASDAPELKIMAAVMLAGMVPPIALALATVVCARACSPSPSARTARPAGCSALSFITEGAIPFAAADPLRVIPAIMLGSAVTGGLSMAMDVGVRAPHGGIFVLFAVEQRPRLLDRPRRRRGRRRVRRHRPEVASAQPDTDDRHRLTPSPVRPRPTSQRRSTMPSKTVVVGSAVGLHARPAAIISEAAGELGLGGDDRDSRRRPVDASSALMIMTLGAGNGDTVEVSGDDQAAVDKIAALVEQDLDA